MRPVLDQQATLTADKEEFVDINDLPNDHEFFAWNEAVNGRVQDVPSHVAVKQLIDRDGEDYRSEDEESPVPELRDRTKDNTTLGRVQGIRHSVDAKEREAAMV